MPDSNPFFAFVVGPSRLKEDASIQVASAGDLGKLNWNLCRFSNPETARRAEEIDFLNLDNGVGVQIMYSALNFKDALAATGHPGVAKRLPLIPGIDAVGVVRDSNDERFKIGDEVLIAHARFGTSDHGGWTGYTRVPGDWLYKLPDGLSPLDAVTWGTAGFTAAQSVERIVEEGVRPEDGPVLVTGATGGVGIFSVKLLHKLGYEVVASTGKLEKEEWLVQNGAKQVISREPLNDTSTTPLLKGQWAAAVDTVGGNPLATVLRSCKPHACVTACGMVAGHDLPLTVYPFILRGVTLCGIDSAGITRQTRQELWRKIATQWKLDGLTELTEQIPLANIPQAVGRILDGKVFGRIVVRMDGEEE
jgi:putative YhdH/YhfP family quinone oxidoreductase